MSEDRERVLRMALKAFWLRRRNAASTSTLTELAIQSMYGEQFYNPADVAEASTAIEVAADALPVIY